MSERLLQSLCLVRKHIPRISGIPHSAKHYNWLDLPVGGQPGGNILQVILSYAQLASSLWHPVLALIRFSALD